MGGSVGTRDFWESGERLDNVDGIFLYSESFVRLGKAKSI